MNKLYRQLLIVITTIFVAWNVLPISSVFAAEITSRKVTVSSSLGGATSVSYTFTSNALPTSGTAIKSVDLQICDQASGSCTHTGNASGFSASSSTLATQPSGVGAASGWTVDTTSQYDLRIKDASNATNPSGAVSIQWNGVTNPTATNATYYIRVTTYTGSDFATGPTDSGTIAMSTSQSIVLNGTMDESLTFCVGGTVGATCGSPTSGNLTFANHFTTGNPQEITSEMAAATNGSYGYNITVNGNTLTCTTCSGSPTITAMGTQSANGSAASSSAGTSQFGMNLRQNNVSGTQPSNPFGSDVSHNSGSSTGTYGTNYGTAQSFRFFTGDTVATASGATDFDLYTVSYIVNVPAYQAAGNYSTTLTYICTATF